MHLKNDELWVMFLLDMRHASSYTSYICAAHELHHKNWPTSQMSPSSLCSHSGSRFAPLWLWVFALPYVTFSDFTRTPLLQDAGVLASQEPDFIHVEEKSTRDIFWDPFQGEIARSHPLGTPTLSNSTKSPLHGVCLQGWPPAGQMPSIRSSVHTVLIQ